MILTDTFIIERVELLTETRGGKKTAILKGVFGRCDEKNNNGRIYSKSILEREVKRISEAMSERRLLGELDHPTHDAVKLSNVSHLITGLSFAGNELLGECELLDTPSGKVAQALVEGGVKVGISSRGMGTLSQEADGTKKVNEDFKLVTFDLVADPSTRGAFPGISESSQAGLVEEIVKETLDTAAKEKVFTTMLKDKLREKLDINQSAEWAKESPASLQKKDAKDAKNKKKPTVEDPFRNWEDFYGYNTGKPRIVRTRGYEDFDTVTAPAEVTENKYRLLSNLFRVEEDVEEKEREFNKYGVLKNLLLEEREELDENGYSIRSGVRGGLLGKKVRAFGGRLAQRGAQLIKKGDHQRLGTTLRSVGKGLTRGGGGRPTLRQKSPEEKAVILKRAHGKVAAARKEKGLIRQAQKDFKLNAPLSQTPEAQLMRGAARGPKSGLQRQHRGLEPFKKKKVTVPFGAGL